MTNSPTKLDFLNAYCKNDQLAHIKILGHTGKSIFSALENFARQRHENGIRSAVHVDLLLRDEGVETPKRREQISTARTTIRRLNVDYEWIHIEIRFYSAIQTLRGAIVQFVDGRKSTYCSAYQWCLPVRDKVKRSSPHPIKTSAVKWAAVMENTENEDEQNGLAHLLENWFDYYWGPGVVHTVAFDFDDTIVDTYKEKIDAWVFAIDGTIKEHGKMAKLIPGFSKHYGTAANDKHQYVKQLVDAYPGKDEILKHILRDDTAPATFKSLEDRRSTYRRNALFPKNKTEEALSAHISAKLFHGVKAGLDRLAWRGYSLAVASLTDEERIEKALKIANIACINTIVGRGEYKNRELSTYLAEKIYLIRKIANLAGIPVSRVLYIGDHHRDEHAANEVGASFIHARLLREVEPSNDPETLYFEDYGSLPSLIDDIESRVRAREIAPQQPMNYA